MKIVHVFKDFYPPLAAGITCYIADVADALARRGHQVEVHVAGVKQSRRDRLPSGVIVHRHRELIRALSMPISPGLLREVRTLNSDIIHVHLPNPIGELAATLNGNGKVVCTFHAQLGRQKALEPLYAPLRKRLLSHASTVLVSGEKIATASELSRHRNKVIVLPFGVSPRLATGPAQHDYNSDGHLRVLFVGRLVYYKGLDVLLRALVRIPYATLRIVGDGVERDSLETLTAELDISQRVTFTGLITDEQLSREYQAANVFVLPSISRAEAFGLATVEAMANGLPAITTSLGTETDSVNLDGVSGMVVPPGDVDSLVVALEKLRDPALRKELSSGAIRHVEMKFSFERHVDTLETIYKKAVL